MSKKDNTDVGDLVGKIEDILEWFESDKVDLDKALKKYEQGLNHINELEKYLREAKVKVNKINKKFEQ